MFKKLALVAASFFLASVGETWSADLPGRYAPPVFASAPPPIFSWTGFYAGVNAGGVVDNRTQFSLTGATLANALAPTTYARGSYPSGHDSGFTGGGQIGANYQLRGTIVVGVEADAAYTDVEQTQNDSLPTGAGRNFHSRLDFLGTVRGRIGYAFDRVLVYGTGGLAYGKTDSSVALTDRTNTVTRFGGSGSDLQTGYAVGGGIEYALPSSSFFAGLGSHAASVKVEYLH